MSKPLSMYSIIGVGEVRNARLLALMGVTVLGMAIVIGYLISLVIDLNKQIAFLKDHQVMYGIPNADGYFVSATKVPDKVISDWAEALINNCYNFDPTTADENLEDCKKRLSTELLLAKESMVNNNKVVARNQIVTQSYTWGQKRIKAEKDGIRFQVRGTLRRLQGSTPYFNENVEVSLFIAHVQPTTARPLGLVATDWSESVIK